MSRFNKLSHVLWHCQYHIIWIPKYLTLIGLEFSLSPVGLL